MSHERTFGTGSLRLLVGDITQVRADAIVNAANEHLSHGGGVAAAIVRAGGQSIQEESYAIAPVPTGGAAATGAGTLRAKHVIHAVGPRGHMADADRLLDSAVRASLQVAEEKRAASIAFPAISTGIFGYPVEKCADIMIRVAVEWLLDADHGVRTILFVLYDEATLAEFARALDASAAGD